MSIPFNNLFEGGPLYIDSEEKGMFCLTPHSFKFITLHMHCVCSYIHSLSCTIYSSPILHYSYQSMHGWMIVEIKFKPVGNIPELPSKINRIRVRMGKAMEDIEHYLRIQLKKNASYTGPIYLYLQECFRPEPEALIFDLFHNYAVDRILEVTYTREPLWG